VGDKPNLKLFEAFQQELVRHTFSELDVVSDRADGKRLEAFLVGLDQLDEPWHVLAKQEQLVVAPVKIEARLFRVLFI
jgi:hypothetical protein